MKKILVVDDEFDISEAVCAILAAEGYPTDICSNGKEAMEYLKSNPKPGLVVLDVMMPFLSGFEVLRQMRSTDSLADVPVILMSAVTPAASQSDFGWNDFLRKPFNLDNLIYLVTKYAGPVSGTGSSPPS